MNFGEKMQALREEKGWNLKRTVREIGTNESQYYRWIHWSDTDANEDEFGQIVDGQVSATPRPKGKKPAKGSKIAERKPRGSHPSRVALIRMAETFGVDLEWLIDDRKGWGDRPNLVGLVADRMKQLTPAEALRALELWQAEKTRANGNGPDEGRGRSRSGK